MEIMHVSGNRTMTQRNNILYSREQYLQKDFLPPSCPPGIVLFCTGKHPPAPVVNYATELTNLRFLPEKRILPALSQGTIVLGRWKLKNQKDNKSPVTYHL